MALTPEVLSSQFDTSAVFDVGDGLNVSMLDIVAVFNVPSDEVLASAIDIAAITESPSVPVEVSQFDLIVVCRGRVEDPVVRVCTFTLDAHDYYLIRLGTEETLVYDNLSSEWYTWGSGDSDLWRAYTMINWIGGSKWGDVFGSNVIAGDDSLGVLYFLDPEGDVDDDALEGPLVPRPFMRRVVAQYVFTGGYDAIPCFGVQMFGSVGQDASVPIELQISDNRGDSYVSAGVRTIPANEFGFRLQWQSLGSIVAPGRLFRFTDYGAIHRIDNVEMVIQDE
jgi:hypothetical protein